jgi:hypothetical protein
MYVDQQKHTCVDVRYTEPEGSSRQVPRETLDSTRLILDLYQASKNVSIPS